MDVSPFLAVAQRTSLPFSSGTIEALVLGGFLIYELEATSYEIRVEIL